MKELSIGQKSQRYDEALKAAIVAHKDEDKHLKATLERIFPELKESEDERIRKWLIEMVEEVRKANPTNAEHNGRCSKAIAWLEKQGEKSSDKIVEKARTEKQRVLLTETDGGANIDWDCRSLQDVKLLLEYGLDYIKKLEKQSKQKPADSYCRENCKGFQETGKCFADGDCKAKQEQIKKNLQDNSFRRMFEQKSTDKVEPKFRKGDWVVYCNDDVDLITGVEENGYCINNSGYIPFICESDVRLWTIQDAKDGDVLVSESTCGLGTWYCIFKSLDGDESMTVHCYLARDGRFETKKELCFDKDPYNTNPATKEQRDLLFQKMHEAGYEWDADKKELKKIESESAWSDEDEKQARQIERIVHDDGCTQKLQKQIADWLKSLKERYTWKPSDEQMDALRYVTNFDYGGYKATLVSLYEQLKKLRGE